MDEQNQNPNPGSTDPNTAPGQHPQGQRPNPESILATPPPAAQTTFSGSPAVSVPTNTLAIVSLVSSILSWVALPFVGGIVALVTGYMARKEIRESLGAQTGDGMALTGIIVGGVNVLVSCLVGCLLLAAIGAAIASAN